MAVDTPASIVILGAGPIGLEAALYARFLGYDVELLEQADVAHHVLRWGHVRMFTPFGMNCSPLGRAALQAQDSHYQPPAEDQLISGREWAERYLIPLSQTDLLADSLRTGRRVVTVGRRGSLKSRLGADRDEQPLRVLSCDGAGREYETNADIVIDTTGVFGQPNWMGPGGTPALGERQARDGIAYGLPDVLGEERGRYAGRHVLVVGHGYSAATTLVALAALADQEAQAGQPKATRVTWLTRPGLGEHRGQPIERISDDRLASRDELAAAANRLAAEPPPGWEYRPETTVESVRRIDGDGGQETWEVTLGGLHAGSCRFDRIVANVGYRPDLEIIRELQVHLCYASEGPMKLAARLLGEASIDCLAAPAPEADLLCNPEPNFYVLGSKSYGRNSQFLFANGLEQIRTLFALIGDRADLDLYQGARSLPQ